MTSLEAICRLAVRTICEILQGWNWLKDGLFSGNWKPLYLSHTT